MSSLSLFSQLRYTSSPFQAGEVLTYKVKWSFFRLGTVMIRQAYADTAFPQFIQVGLDGESAEGLPFIDVIFRSTSLLQVDTPATILYDLATDRAGRVRASYIADPANARMFCLGTENTEIVRLDTLGPVGNVFDGVGLLMYTRCAAGSDTTVQLPTVMDYALGTTTIRFSPDTELVSVAAFDDRVRAYTFSGTTDWKGESFGGMTGAFRGWVSADERRLVLRAEVKIFLGSAVLELEKAESRSK